MKRIIAWLPGHIELGGLIGLLVVVTCVWGFAGIADDVVAGDTARFDETILLALRAPDDITQPLGPAWVQEMMRDLSALGGIGFLTLLTLATTIWLWLGKNHRSAIYLLFAVGTGVAISSFAKSLFERPRPDLVPHGSFVHTASFPSGHSMMAAVVYLTLAVMIARLHESHPMKVFVITLALFLMIGVGVSRVYLGVHWPTDVLAGWSLGTAWALLCWVLAGVLARRGVLSSGKS
ncbi:phosphatase PAP2 family protein [Octadecabacter sp. R77987]|uniref:phosphatase PAP2 family protein n=1 Tax=Octadecabacter sp. R77987 TaxID=3093874 RepID=UPI00366F9567